MVLTFIIHVAHIAISSISACLVSNLRSSASHHDFPSNLLCIILSYTAYIYILLLSVECGFTVHIMHNPLFADLMQSPLHLSLNFPAQYFHPFIPHLFQGSPTANHGWRCMSSGAGWRSALVCGVTECASLGWETFRIWWPVRKCSATSSTLMCSLWRWTALRHGSIRRPTVLHPSRGTTMKSFPSSRNPSRIGSELFFNWAELLTAWNFVIFCTVRLPLCGCESVIVLCSHGCENADELSSLLLAGSVCCL